MTRGMISAAAKGAVSCVLFLAVSCLPKQAPAPSAQSLVAFENPACTRILDDSSGVLRPPAGHLKVDWRRKNYAYSIVPGGVYTRGELELAMEQDRCVARHYGEVNFPRLKVERLTQTKFYYASFSMDGQIYWTSHPIPVRKGESVLSDGKKTIRARCGNQLSEWPQTPLAPRTKEPQDRDFEFGEIIPAEEIQSLTGHRGSFVMPPFWLPILMVPPHHRHPIKPVPLVPEPSSWLLVASGLAFLGAGAAWRSRGRRRS